MSLKVHKAVDLCEEILDELALLPLTEHEFVASARPRVEGIRGELIVHMVVSDRHINVLREIGKGIEMRQPREPSPAERKAKELH